MRVTSRCGMKLRKSMGINMLRSAAFETLESRRLLTATVSGTVFRDVTGNGLGSGDTAMGGVTVKLYKDVNNSGGLDIGDGAAVKSASSDSITGGYSFGSLSLGRYFVQGSVPSNSVRTAPATSSTITVNATTDTTYGGKNFANYVKTFDRSAVTNISYLINGTTVVNQ